MLFHFLILFWFVNAVLNTEAVKMFLEKQKVLKKLHQ